MHTGCHILGSERGKCFVPVHSSGVENILEKDPPIPATGEQTMNPRMSSIFFSYDMLIVIA